VTSFEFNVHPMGPVVQGGLAIYTENEIHSLLKYYRQKMTSIPDELSLLTVIRHLPEKMGTLYAVLSVCHCSDQKSSSEEIEELHQFGNPVTNTLGPISYSKLNTLVDDSFPKLTLSYWKSSYAKEPTYDVIECLVIQFKSCPSGMSRIIIDPFHGEAIRPAKDSTAYPNRSEGFYILIISLWIDGSDSEKNIEWTRRTYEILSPSMAAGVYSNYMSDDASNARVHGAFAGNYPRLQKLKAKFDPENRLRGNQNITPAA
jgi:FAD/FMN-containing dehydrogenase